MAALAHPAMSFEQFVETYANCDRKYEYWQGAAIPKPMGTTVRGKLQMIIASLLKEAGFDSSVATTLRIDPNYGPEPDVIGVKGRLEEPYPTTAVDVVVEILSGSNDMRHMLAKCKRYTEWGCREVYIVDPLSRDVFRWFDREGLKLVQQLATIPTDRLWQELDKQLPQ